MLGGLDVSLSDLPGPVKVLVWLSVGAAAWVSIWKSLNPGHWAKVILKELTPNSGGSVKDKVNQAAVDSKMALDYSVLLDRRTKSISARQRKHIKDMKAVKEEISKMKTDHQGYEKRLARFIVHEGRRDLGVSLLVKEEERRLEGLDQTEKEKYMRETNQ